MIMMNKNGWEVYQATGFLSLCGYNINYVLTEPCLRLSAKRDHSKTPEGLTRISPPYQPKTQ